MKRTILVVLAAFALVALMVGTAFAQGYGANTSAYPGYLIPGDPLSPPYDPNYTDGTAYKEAAVSPHGDFTLSSTQCAVCHSVHHAPDSDSLALLAGYNPAAVEANSADGGCVFCHVDTEIGYIQVYDGDYTNFTTASDNAHDTDGGAACSYCHQVHAASESMASEADAPYLVQKILQKGAWDAVPFPADNEGQVSVWCTSCHSGYYSKGQAYDGGSHIMTTASADYKANNPTNHGPAGQIAQAGSATCHDCHSRGVVDQAGEAIADPRDPLWVQPNTAVNGGSFPHYTDGARFLQAASDLDNAGAVAGATDSHLDAVCYSCHRGDAVISTGVGVGW